VGLFAMKLYSGTSRGLIITFFVTTKENSFNYIPLNSAQT